jgi:hypothetical protein
LPADVPPTQNEAVLGWSFDDPCSVGRLSI